MVQAALCDRLCFPPIFSLPPPDQSIARACSHQSSPRVIHGGACVKDLKSSEAIFPESYNLISNMSGVKLQDTIIDLDEAPNKHFLFRCFYGIS